jgi:hypothetical protein
MTSSNNLVEKERFIRFPSDKPLLCDAVAGVYFKLSLASLKV